MQKLNEEAEVSIASKDGVNQDALRLTLEAGSPPTVSIVVAVAISFLEVAATLAFPIIAKRIVDSLSDNDAGALETVISPAGFLLLVILITGAVAGALSTYLLSKAGLEVVSTLRTKLADRLLRQPVSYFDERQSGEHASRITNDTSVIARLVTTELQSLVTGVSLFVGSVIILSVLDVWLTAAIFGILISAFVVMGPIMMKMSRITEDINNANATLTATLSRTFREIRLVKAFTAEQQELSSTKLEINQLRDSNLRSAAVQAFLQPIVSLALVVAMLAIFGYGGARVELGTLTIGTLTAFILYIFNIVSPMVQLSSFFSSYQEAKGASAHIAGILRLQPEEARTASAGADKPSYKRNQNSIVFQGVTFAYGDDTPRVLDIERLVFEGGRKTAIVGPSGSGKTTILSLIERFHSPQSGTIFWGDIDIRTLQYSGWRKRIGYVPQSAPLMAGTVRENIEYGLLHEVQEDALIAAAEAANCLDFIKKMPSGFDSQVGEGGVRLSGGQKQRIAIARAFLRDPEIVLLDEATSSLDQESETAVLGALNKLMIDRTTVMVTHRASTLRDVDFIAVVQDGRISDFGPASAIRKASEYFSRLQSHEKSDVMLEV